MKRIVVEELIDTGEGTTDEAVASLTDMKMFNRYFGGVRTMTSLLYRVATEKKVSSLSWLDVAGGLGGLIEHTSAALAKKNVVTKPVLLDRVETHLNRRYTCVCADALSLPFRDNSFDVVGSCLFVHHLNPDQVVAFINEAMRVARYAVLINDLIRHPLHLAIAWSGIPIYRSRLTRHDAPVSVRRAYTVEEIKSLLSNSTAYMVDIQEFYLYRMGAIVWKLGNGV